MIFDELKAFKNNNRNSLWTEKMTANLAKFSFNKDNFHILYTFGLTWNSLLSSEVCGMWMGLNNKSKGHVCFNLLFENNMFTSK